jgi:hypothetical protein
MNNRGFLTFKRRAALPATRGVSQVREKRFPAKAQSRKEDRSSGLTPLFRFFSSLLSLRLCAFAGNFPVI